MKKIIIGALILLSFYYTNGIIKLLKEKDPLMLEIKKTESKYQIPFQNASIEGNNIIPGIIGKAIDYDKTYQKMKEYGTYNESLTILKEIKPVISIEENYDKYIIGGNPKKKMISILFLIKEEDQLEPLLQTLKKEQKKAKIYALILSIIFLFTALVGGSVFLIVKHITKTTATTESPTLTTNLFNTNRTINNVRGRISRPFFVYLFYASHSTNHIYSTDSLPCRSAADNR